MGYSAYVVCNCFQKGKTSNPPYQEYFKFDDDGIYLDIPQKIWKKAEQKAYEMDSEFEEWKNTACEHREMELCYERLANISGMSNFRQIIHKLGGKVKYPILTEYLPTANGGILPANLTEKALLELNTFENEVSTEERVILIENSTKKLKATVNSDEHSIFVFTKFNTHNYGIDKAGFFILENVEENGQEVSYVVFQSKNFRQRKISKDNFRFIDNKTGKSYFCSVSLNSDDENPTEVYEYSVIEKKVSIENEYNYIIEPLKKLIKSSIESGNPIHWI
jgi:hypothetical protein